MYTTVTPDEPPETPTRPTDEIDPMIPIMPREPSALPDGGQRGRTRTRPRQTRPLDTSYATEATRHTEEILPFVPDLTRTDANAE